MCGEALGGFAGGRIDVHSGGVDLRFPHHENEIAQSEACLDCEQWVNYFVHSGHLSIEGLKMSKSLKNFITIRDAVGEYGARALRLAFLRTRYNAPMSYSVGAMEEVRVVEKTFSDFFGNVKAKRRAAGPDAVQRWEARDKALAEHLCRARADVRRALAGSSTGYTSVLLTLLTYHCTMISAVSAPAAVCMASRLAAAPLESNL
jgi:cysteinyl-tRNA synthetase